MSFAIEEFGKRMDGALEALRKEFAGLRTGRASTGMLDPIMVEVYGSMMPLNQVGTVGVPEPRLLTVQVWDKGSVKAVEKAIRESGLGLNPQPDGQLIRVPIPELNQERRAEIVKISGKYAEGTRVAVRNVRRDAMDALKKGEKDGDLTEDDQKNWAEKVQKITDEHIKKVDELLASKEKEVMHI
jgi:ribosome recycling factor